METGLQSSSLLAPDESPPDGWGRMPLSSQGHGGELGHLRENGTSPRAEALQACCRGELRQGSQNSELVGGNRNISGYDRSD